MVGPNSSQGPTPHGAHINPEHGRPPTRRSVLHSALHQDAPRTEHRAPEPHGCCDVEGHLFIGLIGTQAGDPEVLDAAGAVQSGAQGIAGVRKGPGAVQDSLEHRVQVQALVDVQAGLAQAGEAVPQRLILPLEIIVLLHVSTRYPDWGPSPVPRGRSRTDAGPRCGLDRPLFARF